MFGGCDDLEIEGKYITFTALGFSDIKEIKVLRYWAREKLGGNLDAIRVLTVKGDSMSGTIEDGSVLFVDESVRYFNGDGLYILLTPNGLKAKRLQITVSGSLNVISDNPRYPIETVPKEEIDTIQICGKVKGCWQMKRL
ncbi:MAG: S24 family peptidase [Neisseriaceae bacterium]|nr:S24 family peptidase [Neisseriaceae bacterium]